MDKINFCGFKNAGYFRRIACDGNPFEHNVKAAFMDESFLNIQLKDDLNGNDLTEFKKLLSTTDMDKTPNPIGRDFVNLAIIKEHSVENGKIVDDHSFFINDDRLDVNDGNLKFLSYIVKLVKRISETPEEKFARNFDFVDGPEAPKAIVLGEDMDELGHEVGIPFMTKDLYKPKNVKAGAEDMFNTMQNIMMDYFA